MKRYALLDTDFISKTHSVQDDGGNHLIDRVMELPEYEFFCHAQIVTELNRYNADAPIWLSKKIGAQKIKSYTDQEILESLSLVRGPLACATYTQMLKLACDAFSKDYFSEHYRALEEADYTAMSREDYLKELERLDIEVGKKNNLGEIKSFVLLQVLSVMLGEQIYVFCSDDKNARNRWHPQFRKDSHENHIHAPAHRQRSGPSAADWKFLLSAHKRGSAGLLHRSASQSQGADRT